MAPRTDMNLFEPGLEIGNQQLPILGFDGGSTPSLEGNSRTSQSVAFMGHWRNPFINLNENLTTIGVILLKKRPRRVHVGVAKQTRRICAVKRFLEYFIAVGVHIEFTSGGPPWRSSQ